jgi:hypothetical protein
MHSLHSGLVPALFTYDFVEDPCAEYACDKQNYEDYYCDVSLKGEVRAPTEGRHCVVDSRMWGIKCGTVLFVSASNAVSCSSVDMVKIENAGSSKVGA